jgi:hypothetical protein
MATKVQPPPRAARSSHVVDRATLSPGDYGRVIQADGTVRWWVRSASGAWTALSHQRVVENDDGTITLLYLKNRTGE